MIRTKVIGLVVAGLMAAATSAQAAVLSVIGGDNTPTIVAAFDLTAETGLVVGAPLVAFDAGNAAGGGLFLSGPGKLTFEYLGSEAGFTNSFSAGGSSLFANNASLVGDTASGIFAGGPVDFLLETSGGGVPGSARNGGPVSGGLSFAFAAISDTSVILLFGDGAGDVDRDDLAVRVSVSQVPLPAAVWLLLSAVLGLVSFSRVRRAGVRAA